MINFKEIHLSDKNIIDSYLAGNMFRSCGFCFTNMLAWQVKFKTTFAVIEQTLFVRYFDADEKTLCYLMPVGKMDLQRSLSTIIDDAKENNVKFTMKHITQDMWDNINTVMPNTFQRQNDRDNDDYIYLRERLVSLSGRKLQSKRNHINRFKLDNPQWEYLTLSSQKDMDECSDMLDKWDDLNIHKARESLQYDYLATKIMLENFHFLQLRGGAIRINGKIVAFTLGEQLTGDTFVIHVEKAYNGINGAYAIINQQFAEREAAAYKYINREEDMGLDYLRKAKLSYYPDILLQKNTLVLPLSQVS